MSVKSSRNVKSTASQLPTYAW